jgi:UDP-N-acetylmuramoylalanine--D-glutamate ligase
VYVVDKMKDAVDTAREFARKGDTVLLSPGATSFGIFKNEFDRGDQFVKLVKKNA